MANFTGHVASISVEQANPDTPGVIPRLLFSLHEHQGRTFYVVLRVPAESEGFGPVVQQALISYSQALASLVITASQTRSSLNVTTSDHPSRADTVTALSLVLPW